MNVSWLRSFVKWFVIVFAIAWVLIYILFQVVVPIIALCFGLVYAACQSGSGIYLFASMWVVPLMIALLTSPLMIDYANLRKERNQCLK